MTFFSLTKDMTGKEDVYRGPAIRALCRITDVSSAFVFLLVVSRHLFFRFTITYKNTSYVLNYTNYIFFFLADHHAASHWTVHEAGNCWQGPQCVQFSSGLLIGKECNIFRINFQSC